MHVLLILAATEELDASHAVAIPILAPPMTLPLLAEICIRAGHFVERLDTRFFSKRTVGETSALRWELDWGRIEETIANSPAEIVCLSFLSSSAANAMRLAKHCHLAGKTVIGGGLHASVALDEFLSAEAFDYVIQGDAERSLPLLLNAIAGGTELRHPAQPVVLRGETVRDLSIVPAAADLSYYQPVFDQFPGSRCAYLELSRGCFKDCGFCEVARTGAAASPLRKIPIENVLATLEALLRKHAVDYLVIADSIATLFKDHFKQVMTVIAANYPNVTVQFNSTVDRWDDSLAAACAKLKCNVWFGFESGSQRVLDEIIHKGTTVAQAYAAAEVCRAHEIPCAFNILLGLPGETPDDYVQTFEVLKRCDWVYPNPNIFNPLPGTALYALCQREHLLQSERDYSIWDRKRIEASGAGPVKGINYARVVEYYGMYVAMQSEPKRTLMKRWNTTAPSAVPAAL